MQPDHRPLLCQRLRTFFRLHRSQPLTPIIRSMFVTRDPAGADRCRCQPSPRTRACRWRCLPRLPAEPNAARLSRGALHRRRRACHALTAPEPPSVSSAPSLTHVMLRNSHPPLHAGFARQSHSPLPQRQRLFAPPSSDSAPEASLRRCLDGILRVSGYYGPLRQPLHGPACPSRGARQRAPCRVHGTDVQRFPACCYGPGFHLPCMPTPIPRRSPKPAGALVALFPDRSAARPLSAIRRRESASALTVSRPRSAFTRVASRRLHGRWPPKAARRFSPECFSPMSLPP